MRERGIVRYQFLILSARRRRRCLRFSDPTTVRSWCSTTTAIYGVLRRGTATDLMGEVDDAPAARRIALMLGERPMWWSPEKDAGTKKAGQSGEGRRGTRAVTAHYTYLTRWSWRIRRLRVGCAVLENSVELRRAGTARRGRKSWKSGRMGDFYVTSEARAGCELAY
jgi:hypothetical protein